MAMTKRARNKQLEFLTQLRNKALPKLNVSVEVFTGRDKSRVISRKRQLFVAAAIRIDRNISYNNLAQTTGRVCHTNSIYFLKTAMDKAKKDETFRNDLNDLVNYLTKK